MSEVLSVSNLSFRYPGSDLLFEQVNFTLREGELLGIIGPSGCGKSSLALILCGIIPHSIDGELAGEVYVTGSNICELPLPQLAVKVGIVFQDPETQLFLPQVRYELAFGPENLCLSRGEILEIIKRTAALTVLDPLLECHPHAVSGGQQQLAALAAVLCLDPVLLIFDEVASQLDQESAARILSVIKQLKEKGKSIIMIDHNPARLIHADRVLVMGLNKKHCIIDGKDIRDEQIWQKICYADTAEAIN